MPIHSDENAKSKFYAQVAALLNARIREERPCAPSCKFDGPPLSSAICSSFDEHKQGCLICGGRYYGHGTCENAPFCPRAKFRRKSGDLALYEVRDEWFSLLLQQKHELRQHEWY